MARDLSEKEKTDIEIAIDNTSLAAVLLAIESICEQKRDHVEQTYHDANTAQPWHDAGYRIRRCAEGKRVQAVSK